MSDPRQTESTVTENSNDVSIRSFDTVMMALSDEAVSFKKAVAIYLQGLVEGSCGLYIGNEAPLIVIRERMNGAYVSWGHIPHSEN